MARKREVPEGRTGELQTWVREAVAQKRPVERVWDTCWDYYNGVHWKHLKGKMPAWAYDHTTTLNLVKPVINTILPIIGDAASIWYVGAYSPEDDVKAEKLTKYLQAFFHDNGVAQAYMLAAKDALCMGTGALKVFLNKVNTASPVPCLQRGPDTRVDVAYLDPYTLYPDPDAQNLEDCRFLALRNVMGESLVRRLYGKNVDFEKMESETPTDRRGEWYSRTRPGTSEARYKVWEVYHDYGEKLTVFSGDEVLWEGESPIPGYRFPVVLFLDDERGNEFWGKGLTSNGASEIQRAVNELVWDIKLHAVVCLMPRFVSKGAGNVIISNQPDAVINLPNPQAELAPLPTPNFPPYVFNLIQLLLRLWDVTTGVHDVTQGVRPVGVQSGRAILQLQEAAQTRIRQIIRSWGLQLGKVGQLVLDMMQVYYEGVRSVFSVTDAGPERVTIDDTLLRNGPGDPIPYRVVVQPQQDLPLTQSARAELLMQLAAVPWPDPALQKLVFNALRIPERFEYFRQKEELAAATIRDTYARELREGLMGQQELQAAASPSPAAPDNSDLDFVAILSALTGGAPPPEGGSVPGAVPEQGSAPVVPRGG